MTSSYYIARKERAEDLLRAAIEQSARDNSIVELQLDNADFCILYDFWREQLDECIEDTVDYADGPCAGSRLVLTGTEGETGEPCTVKLICKSLFC